MEAAKKADPAQLARVGFNTKANLQRRIQDLRPLRTEDADTHQPREGDTPALSDLRFESLAPGSVL